MEILPLGDSALLLRLVENFDEDPDEALNKVLTAKRQLEAAELPGVIEFTPAYTSVAFYYDPIRVVEAGAPQDNILPWLEQRIRDALQSSSKAAVTAEKRANIIEVPVCYEKEFALDLDDVAQRAGMSAQAVVDLHSSAEYRVHCVGFTPGFPYLGGLPRKLATPRKEVPRKEIPAGSVAIGGSQTGIYPTKSPGGWHVIGRTPLRLFNTENNPPALLSAGDRVRFRPITREQFEKSTS